MEDFFLTGSENVCQNVRIQCIDRDSDTCFGVHIVVYVSVWDNKVVKECEMCKVSLVMMPLFGYTRATVGAAGGAEQHTT